MKTIKFLSLAMALAFTTIACDDNNEEVIAELEVKTVSNLYAPEMGGRGQEASGEFAKFSFKTGTTVTGDDWDIAFRATKIIVNGGSAIGLVDEPNRTGESALSLETGTLAEITAVPENIEFKQDAEGAYALPTGADNGWYGYSGSPDHKITPLAGKVLIIKTTDGHYAKMEILSYYKDQDSSNSSNPDNEISGSQYYTFNYVYQSNNSTEF
ncbi:HmuY family protein [Wenyingzhuangia sp. IMCC45467]